MPHTSTTTPRTAHRATGADPVDVATVRALWCALHPDAPIRVVVEELVAEARQRPDALHEAMRRLQSGRLERSPAVIEPALAVLRTALAETGRPPAPAGTNDPGAPPAGRPTMAP